MNDKQKQYDWAFGLLWLITCAVGVAIGGSLAFLSMWGVGEAVGNVAGENVGGMVAGLLFGFLFALGANVGPGILLVRKGISAARWIIYGSVAAALSVSITLGLAFNVVDEMSEAASAVVIALALGLPIGIAQWLLLRQRGMSANGWPLISTAAYFLVAIIITTTSEDSNMPLILASAGLILGAVTGLGMMWLQRRQTVAAA